MNMRKITSLTLLISFIALVLTSVVLYIVPEGRVAYWSDWHWLGLSKTQWGDIHINLGFLFLGAGLMHLWYNWTAMVHYLKNKAKELWIFTPAFTVALLVNVGVALGTLLYLPPFSSILEFGHSFKDAAADKYGEPPYGHAELSSLTLFAKRTGLELKTVKAGLNAAGIRFIDDQQTILAIAKANGLTPKAVYEAMDSEAATTHNQSKTLPAEPFPGMGRIPLTDLCSQYGLDQQRVLAALAAKNITADPAKSLREIAEANGSNPHALFYIIHETTTQQ